MTSAHELVSRTCAAQGLPVVVSDREMLRRIAALLGGRRDERPAEAGLNATIATTAAAKRGGRRGDG